MVQSKLDALVAVALFPMPVTETGEFLEINDNRIVFKCRKSGSTRILTRYIPIERVLAYSFDANMRGTLVYVDTQAEIKFKGYKMAAPRKGGNEPVVSNFSKLTTEDSKTPLTLCVNNKYFVAVAERAIGNDEKKARQKAVAVKDKTKKVKSDKKEKASKEKPAKSSKK
jgi:hypothetical protein